MLVPAFPLSAISLKQYSAHVFCCKKPYIYLVGIVSPLLLQGCTKSSMPKAKLKISIGKNVPSHTSNDLADSCNNCKNSNRQSEIGRSHLRHLNKQTALITYMPRNMTNDLQASLANITSLKDKIININAESFDICVKKGREVLKSGGIIALPTDTIYGVSCQAQNTNSISNLYKIKNRDVNKPIALCVNNISQIHEWAEVNVSDDLLLGLLPGAVTLVFRRREERLNPHLNPGTPLVAVRIPDYTFIRQLCMEEPLALTSANTSNMQSSISIQEFRSLWPHVDVIFDGGVIGSAAPTETDPRCGSTVVDLSVTGTFSMTRRGVAFQNTIDTLLKHGLTER